MNLRFVEVPSIGFDDIDKMEFVNGIKTVLQYQDGLGIWNDVETFYSEQVADMMTPRPPATKVVIYD